MPCLLLIMGAQWLSPQILHIALCTLPCIMLVQRTRPTSTQWPVLQDVHTCLHVPLPTAAHGQGSQKQKNIWRKLPDSPRGAQYWSLFPEITTPCNYWGLLIDPSTGESYPMAVVGDFCLKDIFFPGSPRDSLLFNKDDLTRLKRNPHLPPPRR